MHIHVAPLVPATSSNILIAAKQATNMQTVLTKDPTVITAGGHTVAAYFFKEGSTPPKVVSAGGQGSGSRVARLKPALYARACRNRPDQAQQHAACDQALLC